MKGFNVNHPEKRSGEVFLINTSGIGSVCIGYETKRLGDNAYDSKGNLISNPMNRGEKEEIYPVFVKYAEMLNAGIVQTPDGGFRNDPKKAAELLKLNK